MKKNNILKKITLIYIYIQPLLDIIAAFLINGCHSNIITNSIRLLFAFYLLMELLINKYDNKKRTIIYLISLTIYLIISLFIRYRLTNTYYTLFDLKNSLSTFYFIIMLIGFSKLYKEEIIDEKHIRNVLITYVLLTFIPNILNIGFDSYAYAKLGSSGWFYSANVVGSIIILLLPMTLKELNKLKLYIKIPLTIIILYVILSLGTKTPLLGITIIIFGNIIYYLYILIKNKKSKQIKIILATILLTILTLIVVLPKTNFYKNIIIHLDYLKGQNVKVNSVEFLDHFIFSQRLTFAKNTKNNYMNSTTLEKIFGIGYTEQAMTPLETTKTIEIDYLDIFFRHGIIGLILFFIPVIVIILKEVKKLKLNFNGINKLIDIILILLLALFQGHIFITPAISIFVALIINKKIIQNE